ncbi:MAG TPA: hypothetical protein VEX69_06910 [Candidatus Limnocylindria bacterium]|nr:hypothetical protein [Candidatus Limnocylindria bacterium]
MCLATALWHAPAARAQEIPEVPAAEEIPKPLTAQVIPRMEADPSAGLLDTGFHALYELKFKEAREQFLAYQKAKPDDPLGKVAEAASYLFEEFNDKGVLTSEFFLNDDRFLGGVEGSPAENRNSDFLRANHEARAVAKKRVKSDPHDAHGLLVLTMTDGMESNYMAMIEKKQLPALSLMRQAESEANTLLGVNPDEKDAYVALGMSNYVIGCLPGYKKAFLWFGGVHGDRNRGITQMQSAAEHGHYLKPFAKILLALAYEREHQSDRAQPLLAALSAQFPENPIFARELELIDKKPPTPTRKR